MEEVRKVVEDFIKINDKFIKEADEVHTKISLDFCNATLRRVLEVIKENE